MITMEFMLFCMGNPEIKITAFDEDSAWKKIKSMGIHNRGKSFELKEL